MKENNYPGIKSYSDDKSFRPPLYSNRDFEKLIATPPVFDQDPEGFNSLLSDLQSNILLHHQRNFSRCYFLHFKADWDQPVNTRNALEWLLFISGKITPALKQLEDKFAENKQKEKDKKAALAAAKTRPIQKQMEDNDAAKQKKENDLRSPVFCLYLTWKGYSRLGLEHLTPFDDRGIFEKGLSGSMPSLFSGKPDTRFSDGRDLHAMLLVASDDKEFKDALKKVEYNKGNPCEGNTRWADVIEQNGFLKKTNMGGDKIAVDWFGFRDGISQPLFFPDKVGRKSYEEDDLASLRIVLTKDRGGRNKYSAGSFLAYLKIEQDKPKFELMENTIAAHTAVFGIEALIAKKKINKVVPVSAIEKVIEIDPVAVTDLAINNLAYRIGKIIPGTTRTQLELVAQIRKITDKKNIAEIIGDSEIGKLVSISPDKKQQLLDEILDKISKIREPGNKTDVDFNELIKDFNNKIEFLKSEAEITFLNTRVIDKMIESIVKGASISKIEREELQEILDTVFSVNGIEKRNLIGRLSKDELSLVTVQEVAGVIRDRILLAEAYIMGRFKDGTPVTTSSQPEGFDSALHDSFSYGKKLISNGKSSSDDRQAIRCPFAAHARKANPRSDQQKRLIARRGVLYDDNKGNGGEPGKGMLFMSFQANLAEQFEYIMKHWINNVNYDKQLTGVDLLAGTGINRTYSRWYFPVSWNNEDPDAKVLLTANELKPCVKYLEGEYFFAPSISFLKNIKHLSAFGSNNNEQAANQSNLNSKEAQGPPQIFQTKPVFDGYPIKPIKLLRGIIQIKADEPVKK